VPNLFKEFWRAKNATTAAIPGTGLGLAICQRLLTELGGTIQAKSEEGVGTTFVVAFPLAAKGAAAAAKP